VAVVVEGVVVVVEVEAQQPRLQHGAIHSWLERGQKTLNPNGYRISCCVQKKRKCYEHDLKTCVLGDLTLDAEAQPQQTCM
jgi:hypothetical protein